jgi:hypothetical protein
MKSEKRALEQETNRPELSMSSPLQAGGFYSPTRKRLITEKTWNDIDTAAGRPCWTISLHTTVRGEKQSLKCVVAYLPEISTSGANTAWHLKDTVTVWFPMNHDVTMRSLHPEFDFWAADIKPAALMDFPAAAIGTTVIFQGKQQLKKKTTDEKKRKLTATRRGESGDPAVCTSRKQPPKQCLCIYAIFAFFLESGRFARFDYLVSTVRNEREKPLTVDWAGKTLFDLENTVTYQELNQASVVPYFYPGTKLWLQHEETFYACLVLGVNLNNTTHVLMIAADADASGIKTPFAAHPDAGGTFICYWACALTKLCVYLHWPM